MSFVHPRELVSFVQPRELVSFVRSRELDTSFPGPFLPKLGKRPWERSWGVSEFCSP